MTCACLERAGILNADRPSAGLLPDLQSRIPDRDAARGRRFRGAKLHHPLPQRPLRPHSQRPLPGDREALIAAFTGSADDEEPVVARSSDRLDIPLVPETMSPPELNPKRKGGNRAFQRSLRHRQRLLMNPRGR
jgi:hypothetical protein